MTPPTPACFRRMSLGQFREREEWSRGRLAWTLLGLAIAAAILAIGSSCNPNCAQLEQARDLACASDSTSTACLAARQAFAAAFPAGCPTPAPPPVTEPPSPPPSTLPPGPPPTTLPPPPAAGCVLAGEPSQALPDTYKPKHQAAVLAAIRRAHPSCTWGDCLIDEETQQGFQAKVTAEVRNGGKDPVTGQTFEPLCAGQHSKGTDEIAVAASLLEPREGYNVFSGDDSEIVPRPAGTPRRTIMWAKPMGAWYPPSQQPTPGPDPQPTATPSGCGAPTPVLATFAVKRHDAFCANLDSTAKARGRDYCKAIGFTDGRSDCPIRQEGAPDREACERVALGGDGKPVMRCEGGCQVYQCGGKGEDGSDNCACGTPTYINRNPYRAVVMGKGTVFVCNAAGTVCGSMVLP